MTMKSGPSDCKKKLTNEQKEIIKWESIADYKKKKEESGAEPEPWDAFMEFLPCQVCESPAKFFYRLALPGKQKDEDKEKSTLIYYMCSEECCTFMLLRDGK